MTWPAPLPHIGLVLGPSEPEVRAEQAGVGKRVYFEVWKNVPIYEIEDEVQAKKVIRAVKRQVQRQIHRTEKYREPLPELPQITVHGEADWLYGMKSEITDLERVLEMAYQQAKRAQDDEDDVEMLIL